MKGDENFQNIIYRRLYRILTTPVIHLHEDYTDPQQNCQFCIENATEEQEKKYHKFCASILKQKEQFCQCKDFTSLCLKSVHYKSKKHMETLLKLALLCEETTLTTFVDSIDDLQILLTYQNPTINVLFDKAFTSTKYCEDIESIDYRVDKPRMLLRS